MALLKPLAVLLFLMAGRAFTPASIDRSRTLLFSCAFVAVLCTLAKPSYVIVIVPTMAVGVAYNRLRDLPVSKLLVVGGIILPSLTVLTIMMMLYTRRSDMAFAPLVVFQEWSRLYNPDASSSLVVKFLLSILFPLTVYALYFKESVRDTSLNLAWMGMGFGAAYTYLLVEADRIAHGNFTWSGQIALFMLFLASAIFFLRQNWAVASGEMPRKATPRFLIGLSVLALHLVSGIVWYLAHMSTPISELITSLW